MNSPRHRLLALGLLTGAGALASTMTAALAYGDASDGTALITAGEDGIGFETPTGPDPTFVSGVYDLYVNPTDTTTGLFDGQTVYPGYVSTPLNLPSLDQGIVGEDQINQAATDLNTAITADLLNGPVVSTSYSESSTAATLEIINLDNMTTGAPSPDDLSFILLGDLNNPNGGVFERLSGLNPGIDYYTATPADTPYTTDIYTIQYDGVADFPQYPTDLPAMLNAFAGYSTLHLSYQDLSPAQLADAVKEPVSAADVATNYYMIPTQDMPLLEPMRDIPGIGPALADFFQPDLRVLVDMGYNYNDFQADVPTQADFGVPNYDYTTIFNDLNLGMQQGITAAQVDLGILPSSDLPDIYPFVPYVPGDGMPNPGLIAPDGSSSFESLQSVFSGLDTSSISAALSADLGGLSTDLSSALSHVVPDLAAIGFDPAMFASFLGF